MLIGLVGKPNVGKSTFFKACTLADVNIASYPFTTIKANQGVGYVKVSCPESVAGKKCQPNHGFCLEGERFVPVKLIDVAGLVPEAHKGKGRGNEFLDDLRGADILIHILDASGRTNEEGQATENYPVKKDIEFLEKEINMWIFGILQKNWKNLKRKALQSSLSKEIAEQLSGLKINEDYVKEIIKKLKLNEKGNWSEQDLLEFAEKIREKSKPVIIAANKADLEESEINLKNLKKEYSKLSIVPCSSDYELALREATHIKLIKYIPGSSKFKIMGKINDKQKAGLDKIKNFLGKKQNTGVQECLNISVFSFLKYMVVYPVENEHKFSDSKGNILPDAILLPQNSTALNLAYAIHTDIGESFVGAIDCKTGKKLGKESQLKDGDIVKILTK